MNEHSSNNTALKGLPLHTLFHQLTHPPLELGLVHRALLVEKCVVLHAPSCAALAQERLAAAG